MKRPQPILRALWLCLFGFGLLLAQTAHCAEQRAFVIGGASVTLEDVTADTAVFYTSMRLNRAANVWNVEVAVSNRASRVIAGPVVLLVTSFTNTSGLLQPDGVSSNQAFVDLSAQLDEGVLVSAKQTSKRTLSLGVTTGAPSLVTKVYALPAGVIPGAAVFLRSLNGVGQPLGGVKVEEIAGPGTTALQTDLAFGVGTVSASAGDHTLKFSLQNFLPVWRRHSFGTGGVDQIVSPRLTPRSTTVLNLTPIAGGTTNTSGITVSFGPGAVASNQTATLTPLTQQTLPALLPLGWSPLQAFWLELPGPVAISPNASLRPWGPFNANETGVLVQWDEQNLQWRVRQVITSSGTNIVSVTLPGAGAFALVVPDAAPNAPPSPQAGQPLAAATTPLPNAAGLSAGGRVDPSVSSASLIPELVTGTATVAITNSTGALPSGYVLRSDVRETYRLQSGAFVVTPQYENFIVGYQRPGDTLPNTLHATFPIRPLRLFGADTLLEASVRVNLIPPGGFGGTLLSTNGGLLAGGSVRLLASGGDLSGPQAGFLRSIDSTNLTDIAGGLPVIDAFELNLSGVAAGQQLTLQVTNAPTNSLFVIARTLQDAGLLGMEPVERLASDAQGRLVSLETNVTDHLPGINGPGQYLLLQVAQPQALIKGIARSSSGQPAGGLLVRLAPWTTLSRAPDGQFLLTAPAGNNALAVTDLNTGDSSQSVLPITPGQTTANPFLTATLTGPRVVAITPTNNATAVARVAAITISFNKPVNPATLLNNGAVLRNASNQAVAISLNFNLGNTTATLLPTDPLPPSTRFTVQLSTNVSDALGRKLEGTNSFEFTTESDSLNRLGAQLVIYEPTNGLARMTGGAGLAEPNGPVILVNDNSGATATVLSKPDGSFDNSIEARVDDELSVVILNGNGTRTTVFPSRQVFRDGSVALFNGGGTIEAAGEGGAFQLIIPAGTVQAKTVFKLKPMTFQEVTNSLPNPPVDAQVIAGFEISLKDPHLSGDTAISIPMDPSRIPMLNGAPPEEGAYVLAMVRHLEGGGVAYQIVDKLRYENGRLHSNTAPFKGFGEAFTDAIANNPIGVLGLVLNPVDAIVNAAFTVLVLGNRPITVTGRVGMCPAPPDEGCLDEQLDPFLQGLSMLPGPVGDAFDIASQVNTALGDITRRPLPGAFVSLSLPQTTAGRPGRLQPGIAYANSDRTGTYSLVLPFANGGYIIRATHPRFQDDQASPLRPLLDYELGQGAIRRNFTFAVPLPKDELPRVDISHSPLFPGTNQPATITVDVVHSLPSTIQLAVEGTGPPSAQITDQVNSSPNASQHRLQAKVVSTNEVTTKIKVTVSVQTTGGTIQVLSYHYIPFGAFPPAATNAPIQVDSADKVGPRVERTEPFAHGVLQTGRPLILEFSEPIDASVKSQATQFVLDDPATGNPALVLTPDQTRLELSFAGLKPDKEYELTASAPIKDLAGNALVLPPSLNSTSFKLKFRTQPVKSTILSQVGSGGGVAVHGNFAYVLDRTGDGKLLVYDISNPASPQLVSDSVTFIGFPRDLVVLPAWAHVNVKDGPVTTNDLLAVVGGNLGTSAVTGSKDFTGTDVNVFFQGQYLRVLDISDPAHPQRVLGSALTFRPNAVTKIRWEPPNLVFLEIGSDLQQIGLIDLQEMLVGFNATPAQIAQYPLFGIKGIDGVGTNAPDGDYVDPGERVPTPPHTPNEFFGRGRTFFAGPAFGTRLWTDFDFKVRGNYCGVIFREGFEIDQGGKVTGNPLPPGYRTLAFGDDIDAPSATLPFAFGTVPKRIFTVLNVDVSTNDTPDIRHLALITLSPDNGGGSALAVVDISQPTQPKLLTKIVLPASLNLGFAQSIVQRPNRQLGLATTTDLLVLDQTKILLPAPASGSHPAILAVVPGAGSGNISLGRNIAGVNVIALGSRNQLVQEAPQLQFVRVLRGLTVTDPTLLATDPALRQTVFDAMSVSGIISPSRFSTNGGAISTLSPANSTNHYHILMRAPGGAGPTVKLGLQSLNRSGYPLKNKGRNFAPVRAVSTLASQQIKQEARANCDAPINALTAYRLSDDVKDPFYNVYLSKPFALVYERIEPSEITTLQGQIARELVWSDFNLQGFIDPEMGTNPVLGPFAAKTSTSDGVGGEPILVPRAVVVAESLPGSYIPGPNPPPVSDPEKMPGTFGMISANNGEFRHETIDVALPGRAMPIVFERAMGGQDLYEGPFGFGWDFGYDQRLTPLRPEIIGRDHRIPLILRALETDSTKAEPGDLLWHTGHGRLVLYKNKGNQPPTEVATDPLPGLFGWTGKIRNYYLPSSAEAGVLDPLFEFQDGQFARLTPDGQQYWYNRAGRLEKIYHRYTNNFHKLSYNTRGELTRIVDATIDNDKRFLEIGYYRFSGDEEMVPGVDIVTSKIFVAGKIARLKDYAGRMVDFEYTDDGLLQRRLGFQGSSVNSGDGGRVETTYITTDNCCGLLQGVTTGGSSPTSPLFSATLNPATGLPSGAGNGAGGSVTISPPSQNSAASAGSSTTSAQGPDGGKAKYTLDSHGFPSETEYSGSGAPPAKLKTKYGPYGLLEQITYPLENTVSYTYDTNNVLLRARGNLKEEKRNPGSRPGLPLTRTMPTYDLRYNLPNGVMTDFNGKSVTFGLTADGRSVQSVGYQDAGAHTFTFNEFGQVELETTPEGVKIDPDYNTDGFKSSEKRGNATISFGFDGTTAAKLGLPTSVTLPTHAGITDLKYDDRLQLLQMRRGSFVERRGYDRNGNVKHIERELGAGRTYIEDRTYNQVNFLEKIDVQNVSVGAAGVLITTEFKSTPADNWRIRKIIYPGGQAREFEYDHLGNVILAKLGSLNESYTRDLHGNLLATFKGGQEVQRLEYDGYDRVTKITSFLGGSAGGSDKTEISYYGNGEIKDFTVDSAGFGLVRDVHVTDIDGLGRPKHRDHIGTSATAGYDYTYPLVNGVQIKAVGPRDTITTQYDTGGRLRGVTRATAAVSIDPDDNGNVTHIGSSEDGRSYSADYDYDNLDHLKSHTDPIGQVMRATANADGTFGEVFDGRDKRTVQEFTVLGERSVITRPSGVQFNFQYDKNRQPTLAGDTLFQGQKATYDTATFRLATREVRSGASYTYGGFNPQNLPTSGTSPVGGMTYGFDLQGRLTSQTATHSQGESYQTSFKRDALNRVREAKYGKAEEFTATFTYDKLGPLTSSTYTEKLGSFTVSSTLYDDASRHTLVYPSSQITLTEDRDAAGRLLSISAGGELYRVQNYLGAAQPGNVLMGGGVVSESNDYDARRRSLVLRYEHNGTMLADVRYRYDLSDNREVRQEVHRHGRADLFEYDDDNRLKRADFGARPSITGAIRNGASQLRAAFGFEAGFFARTYGYDGGAFDLLKNSTNINPDVLVLGSLPAFMQSLDNHDGMLFAGLLDGVARPTPDAMGNTTGTKLFVRRIGATDPVPVTATLRYNGVGQLIGISYTDQGVPVSIEYQHQPNGLMHYRKVTRGGTVVSERALVYDQGRLLEEFETINGANKVQARYFYADDDSPFAAELPDAGGVLQRFYYLRDAQGSVMAVADVNGNVVERVSYDAWGQPTIQGRDVAVPRVSAIFRSVNNELLVQFTEPVMPPLSGAGFGTTLVTTTAGLGNLFTLNGTNGPIPLGAVVYEENLPTGFPFGALLRIRPQGTVPPDLSLRVNAGGLVDEWGLGNPQEQISFSLAGTNNVLFQGFASGSTAPPRLARSAIGSPFLFHGQYFDYDAGLLYLRLRFYDPYTGSFLQQDPRGYGDSVNLYAAFKHNPVSLRDPTGAASGKKGRGSETGSHPAAGRGGRAVPLDASGRALPRPLPDPPNHPEHKNQFDPPPPVVHRWSSKNNQTPDDVSGGFDEPTQPGRPSNRRAAHASAEDEFNEPTVEVEVSELQREMKNRFEQDEIGNKAIQRNPTTEAAFKSLGIADADVAKLFNGEVVRFSLPNKDGSPTIGFAKIQGGRLQVEGFSLQNDAGGIVFNLIGQARTVAREIGAKELELIAGQVEESSGRLARILQSKRFGFSKTQNPLSVQAGELDSGNPSFSKIEEVK